MTALPEPALDSSRRRPRHAMLDHSPFPRGKQFPALLLNADLRPTKMVPLETWSYRQAVQAALSDRVVVLDEYEQTIRSPSLVMRLPSVIALREYQPTHRIPPFTRIGCYLRDGFRCQYCGQRFRMDELTFDHVTPKSRGGHTDWFNVATSCGPCNYRKRARTPKEAGLTLLRTPAAPTIEALNRIARDHGHVKIVYAESWTDFIYPNGAPMGLRVVAPRGLQDALEAFPEDMTEEDYWQVPLDEG